MVGSYQLFLHGVQTHAFVSPFLTSELIRTTSRDQDKKSSSGQTFLLLWALGMEAIRAYLLLNFVFINPISFFFPPGDSL